MRSGFLTNAAYIHPFRNQRKQKKRRSPRPGNAGALCSPDGLAADKKTLRGSVRAGAAYHATAYLGHNPACIRPPFDHETVDRTTSFLMSSPGLSPLSRVWLSNLLTQVHLPPSSRHLE